MKKIALDLDGVVFDSENLYRVYTELYDVDNFKKDSLVDNTKRIFQQRYNWSEEENQKFYNTYSKEILMSANLMTGVELVIPKLKESFEIIIITARNETEVKYAKEKLTQMGLGSIKLYYGENDKINKCLEEKVDYIIDDEPSICLNAAANNITGIYLKNNASLKLEENKYIKNVNNWGEIYKYLILNN